MSEFLEALWFGAQGALAGSAGEWFVTRSGLLLGRKWAAVSVALLVALLACSVMLAISIWFNVVWLGPHVHVAAVVAWFGTMAVVSPDPVKARVEGPIGPASRAFRAARPRSDA